MQNKSSKELPTLTDYHWQRSKEASKAVKEMLKHPLSLQQKKEQVARLNKKTE